VKVTVPVHSDPMIGKKITFYENGKRRTFLVAKKVLANTTALYILPDDFPTYMVKLLFGVEAKIEEEPKWKKKWKVKITV